MGAWHGRDAQLTVSICWCCCCCFFGGNLGLIVVSSEYGFYFDCEWQPRCRMNEVCVCACVSDANAHIRQNRNTKSKWFLFHIFIARNKLLLKASAHKSKRPIKWIFSIRSRAFSSRSGVRTTDEQLLRIDAVLIRCTPSSFFACTYKIRFRQKKNIYQMIFRMRQTQQLESFIVFNRFLYLLLSWIVDGFHPYVSINRLSLSCFLTYLMLRCFCCFFPSPPPARKSWARAKM